MTDAPRRSDAPGGHAGGVLVIGYGNALRSDDGVGWHAAALLADDARFADDPRFADVEILARHQLAPELALDMSHASLVILVDASTDAALGSVVVRPLEPAGAADVAGRAHGEPTSGGGAHGGSPGASSHHVGAAELLALSRELYGAVPAAVVVGVGVHDMGVGESLSPAVAAALPVVADTIADLIAAHRAAAH